MSGRKITLSGSTEEEKNELIFRLQALLPQLHPKRSRGSASGVMEEACRYIKRLQREVEELSHRLSAILEAMDPASVEAEMLSRVSSLNQDL